jgi:hypothetical protein
LRQSLIRLHLQLLNQSADAFLVVQRILDYSVRKHVNLQVVQQRQLPDLLVQVGANLNNLPDVLVHG